MKNTSIKLRILFMGTSAFAKTILESLVQNQNNIISVYTQPDKKVGRKQEEQKTIIKEYAEKNNLPVFTPEKLDEKVFSEIKNQNPDLIIVVAYGKIIPLSILEIPAFGSINIHASLLPKYRGPSPIQNAILNGEEEIGTTVMFMNEGVDTGDILSQDKTKIGPDEKYPEISKKLSDLSSKILLQTLPLVAERKISPKKQDESQATFCQLIEKEDGKIIWSHSAKDIYNRYRAFYLWPGIHTFWENGESNKRLKLSKISYEENEAPDQIHIGEVFISEERIAVRTGQGIIILEEVQLEGKENVSIKNFLNGYPHFLGSLLK